MPAQPAPKKLRFLQLVFIIFFTVSGGPYGLEPLLTYAGEHGALLLLIITPLLWDIPAIFTVMELNSMMPVTGGYYEWVKYALGSRWGFYEGWWTWIYTFVDLAIYPVLFVGYAAYFFPGLEQHKTLVCLCVIWSLAGLNILGIVQVGRASVLFSVLVLSPFLILFVLVISQHGLGHVPTLGLQGITFPSLGMALYTVMWNCLGWDNITTYAPEVEQPVRSYLKAIAIAFGLVMVVYVLAIWIALQSGVSAQLLNEKGFPLLGSNLGGRWLGALFAAGGMASGLGIYTAVLLSVSRVPQAMATDNLLPAYLHRLHPSFHTPYVSIILCSVVVSFMVLWTFSELLIIDVTVYGAGLSLEYITLIMLRLKEPNRPRPFKIPLNVSGLCTVLILPLSVYIIALVAAFNSDGSGVKPALFAVATLTTAELAWQLAKRRKKAIVA